VTRSPPNPEESPPPGSARGRLHQIVFESDTAAGRAFDLTLIALILVSVVLVSVETVAGLSPPVHRALRAAEWTLTIVFTIEYALRLIAVSRPLAYATSFFGIVDLLAILPTYISLIFPGTHVLLAVRILRLLRVFRVLKLTRFLSEANTLGRALRASTRKIAVFLLAVSTLVVIVGTLMYVVEGADNGFTSIPVSMYWAVVTLTTVGYGDISPKTPLGQAVASLVMILGYGIIAVPTGIVTAELTSGSRDAPVSGQACPACGAEAHAIDARFCRRGAARRSEWPRRRGGACAHATWANWKGCCTS
jgi:voltage-gated potassium channel